MLLLVPHHILKRKGFVLLFQTHDTYSPCWLEGRLTLGAGRWGVEHGAILSETTT